MGSAVVLDNSTEVARTPFKASSDCMGDPLNTYQYGGACELSCTEVGDYGALMNVLTTITTGSEGQVWLVCVWCVPLMPQTACTVPRARLRSTWPASAPCALPCTHTRMQTVCGTLRYSAREMLGICSIIPISHCCEPSGAPTAVTYGGAPEPAAAGGK
jgi:hypothetical protein